MTDLLLFDSARVKDRRGCMTGPACVDAVSPAMAPTLAPTQAPRSRKQPHKTNAKSTALGARWSCAWEAGSGGATPSRRSWGSLPRNPPASLSVESKLPTPIIEACPNRVRSARNACRLQDPNRDCLVLYARFAGAAVDYVLNHLLETRLLTHRYFVACHDKHGTEVVASNRCDAEARRRMEQRRSKM